MSSSGRPSPVTSNRSGQVSRRWEPPGRSRRRGSLPGSADTRYSRRPVVNSASSSRSRKRPRIRPAGSRQSCGVERQAPRSAHVRSIRPLAASRQYSSERPVAWPTCRSRPASARSTSVRPSPSQSTARGEPNSKRCRARTRQPYSGSPQAWGSHLSTASTGRVPPPRSRSTSDSPSPSRSAARTPTPQPPPSGACPSASSPEVARNSAAPARLGV